MWKINGNGFSCNWVISNLKFKENWVFIYYNFLYPWLWFSYLWYLHKNHMIFFLESLQSVRSKIGFCPQKSPSNVTSTSSSTHFLDWHFMTTTGEKYFQLIWLLGYMIVLEIEKMNYVMKNKSSFGILWHVIASGINTHTLIQYQHTLTLWKQHEY